MKDLQSTEFVGSNGIQFWFGSSNLSDMKDLADALNIKIPE